MGFTVDRHLELGERPAVRAAFDAGEINLAPDYLGGLAAFLEVEGSPDAEAVHADLLPALEASGADGTRLLARHRCRRLRRPPGDGR